MEESEECFVCGSKGNLCTHHVAYIPETTMICCYSCHRTIHAKHPTLSESDLKISRMASYQKKIKKGRPIDFDIKEIREKINNLLSF